ncbi:hypothetical protein EYF80_048267 [Liparis tanakae]|uniref:Uncharacterized protein n=1 Tax=Liparis tanakae TaxID=230148 RepID=A0A4Z2FLC6_9TELE|nr:hypothetical protein EYF80_048267 [Liparis tanakae]
MKSDSVSRGGQGHTLKDKKIFVGLLLVPYGYACTGPLCEDVGRSLAGRARPICQSTDRPGLVQTDLAWIGRIGLAWTTLVQSAPWPASFSLHLSLQAFSLHLGMLAFSPHLAQLAFSLLFSLHLGLQDVDLHLSQLAFSLHLSLHLGLQAFSLHSSLTGFSQHLVLIAISLNVGLQSASLQPGLLAFSLRSDLLATSIHYVLLRVGK